VHSKRNITDDHRLSVRPPTFHAPIPSALAPVAGAFFWQAELVEIARVSETRLDKALNASCWSD